MEFVNRAEWNAQPPKSIQLINKSVPLVLVHHSNTPAACYTDDACNKAMQSMQRFHQVDRGWDDIGYK